MLLVEDSMTKDVIPVAPSTTAAEALALCRERSIRHLPVLEGEELVGIVSDRDLRSATPALGDPGRAAALQRIPVSEAMSPEVFTIAPGDLVEVAASTMNERGVGSLPVVEEGGVVGMITSSDVMEALVYLVGANEPGSRLEVAMPDRPGALAGVSGIFGELGINIVSVAMGASPPEKSADPSEFRKVGVFRVDAIDTTEASRLLELAGYEILWPARP